ncbi:MAG: cysteine desulfurase family protein [Aquiluna sp.]|nr:cysteine desulfurase family protein [Aquiluna sp.]
MSVFLDHASTTALRPSAKKALTEALDLLGNPSSVHSQGRSTRELLEASRDTVAKAVGANRSEIIFNSGGTEGNNHAIKGIYWSQNQTGAKKTVIISSETEHHAVIDPVQWLAKNQGAEVHFVKHFANGMVDFESLKALISKHGPSVALITLMWVNNETGVITDIPRVVQMASEFQIPVHTDAVAALGHIPIDFQASGLTAMSLSGHKVGAPIGIGALVVARSAKPISLVHGGGQERALRSGTMNYPLAASFAAAATDATAELKEEMNRLTVLRDEVEARVTQLVPSAIVTASGADRAGYNAHFIFPGTQSDALLFLLDQEGVCVSAGSACQAGVLGPSHVAIGMGFDQAQASACVRVTLGFTTTADDTAAFIRALAKIHPIALQAAPA